MSSRSSSIRASSSSLDCTIDSSDLAADANAASAVSRRRSSSATMREPASSSSRPGTGGVETWETAVTAIGFLGRKPRTTQLQDEVIAQAQHCEVHALDLGALPLHLVLENRFDVVEQRRQILRAFELRQIRRQGLRRVVPADG